MLAPSSTLKESDTQSGDQDSEKFKVTLGVIEETLRGGRGYVTRLERDILMASDI